MIRLTIDGQDVTCKLGQSVLEAAGSAGIYIPSLCYHPDLTPSGACRLCMVECDGAKGPLPACVTEAREGMNVATRSDALQRHRENIIWLLLSEHPRVLEESSQFKKVVDHVGLRDVLPGHAPTPRSLPIDNSDPLFKRDPNRCILCGRCVQMCREVRGVGAIGFVGRGIEAQIGTPYAEGMQEAACRFCGACVQVCPTGALQDREEACATPHGPDLTPCRNTCPAGVDIPRYVGLIAQGRFQDALEVIRAKVPFPHTLGLVCDHPCEGVCRRGKVHDSVSIRALKRYVAEQDTGRWRGKLDQQPDSGKRVAIVGSGPSGLTAAWFLRLKGHAVTLFEALPELGGMLRVGIPEYRLVSEVLDKEIKDILSLGVDAKTNTPVDSLDTLFAQGFDAVYVAVGASKGMGLGLPGEEDPRVLDGLSVLRDIKLGQTPDVTGQVAVVGGGNVAMDVARSALRLGCGKVTVIYRRTREEMPAYDEEIEEAFAEGVEMQFLTNPVRVLPGDDKLNIECVRMELGEPDDSGRRRPVPVDGSEFILPVDRLLVAIGQQSIVPEHFGIMVNKRGRIEIDLESRACSRQGVFAGGDVQTGAASVVEAINAGREAAKNIDQYLGGDGDIAQHFLPDHEDFPQRLGRIEHYAEEDRAEMPMRPVAERLEGFPEVELGLDQKTAVAEAGRCLRCQLRLEIKDAPLPPE